MNEKDLDSLADPQELARVGAEGAQAMAQTGGDDREGRGRSGTHRWLRGRDLPGR